VRRGLTIPLHTDRIKLVGESDRLLAAGERGRSTALICRVMIINISGVADLMYDLPSPRQILRLWLPSPKLGRGVGGEGKIYASYLNSAMPYFSFSVKFERI
jgi:hypothetical protein